MGGFGQDNLGDLNSGLVQILADDTARAAATPAAAGSPGYQKDIGMMLEGRAASLGAWYPVGCVQAMLDASFAKTNTVLADVPMDPNKNPFGLSVFGFPVKAGELVQFEYGMVLSDTGSEDNYKIGLAMPADGGVFAYASVRLYAVKTTQSGDRQHLSKRLANGDSIDCYEQVGNNSIHITTMRGYYLGGSLDGVVNLKFAKSVAGASTSTVVRASHLHTWRART